MQVLKQCLGSLQQPKPVVRQKKARRAGLDPKALLLPLELRLVLQGAEVKFEHHPMEVRLRMLAHLQAEGLQASNRLCFLDCCCKGMQCTRQTSDAPRCNLHIPPWLVCWALQLRWTQKHRCSSMRMH